MDDEAMLPEFTTVFNQTSVPMQVTEFVEGLVQKVENVAEKNAQLRKQIDTMKEKLEKEKEEEIICRNKKVELLIKFRQLMERQAKAQCKNCPSLQLALKKVIKRISDLLDEQIEESQKVFYIEQKIKVKEVEEEKMLYEITELKEQFARRKADTNKHFQLTKFTARYLRQQIQADLEFKATDDVILAIQKEVTDLALNRAYDEIPNKIASFEKDTIEEALKEVKEEIAARDEGIELPDYDDSKRTRDEKREQYMKWLYMD